MISVIVPAYNAGKFLGKAIESVQAQTYSDWEMVIIDDGSKDDTFAVSQSYSAADPRIRAFTQQNAGVSAARNHGFAETNPCHPYALFLDSDDMLIPETLATLLHTLEHYPNAPAVCGLVQEIDATGAPIQIEPYFETVMNRRGVVGRRLVRKNTDTGISFGDMCFHNYITTPGTVLVKKTALDLSIMFDPKLSYGEDWDFWWRVIMKAGPFVIVPQTVLLYRIHNASASQNRAGARRGTYAFQQRLLTYPEMSDEQKQIAKLGYFYHSLVYGEYASHNFKKGRMKEGLRLLGLAVRDLIRFSQNAVTAKSA